MNYLQLILDQLHETRTTNSLKMLRKQKNANGKSDTQNHSNFCLSIKCIFSAVPLTLTIRIHLIRERPNPEMAPYLPAAEVVRQKDRKNPIQLKRNATVKAEGNLVRRGPQSKHKRTLLPASRYKTSQA